MHDDQSSPLFTLRTPVKKWFKATSDAGCEMQQRSELILGGECKNDKR